MVTASRLLTSLAVEAAEPLVQVLLVLHACPVASKRQVFVVVAGPLGRRRFGCPTSRPREKHRQQQQHLGRQRQGEEMRRELCINSLYRSAAQTLAV